jgi:hypothetical protein
VSLGDVISVPGNGRDNRRHGLHDCDVLYIRANRQTSTSLISID